MIACRSTGGLRPVEILEISIVVHLTHGPEEDVAGWQSELRRKSYSEEGSLVEPSGRAMPHYIHCAVLNRDALTILLLRYIEFFMYFS